MGCTRQPCLCRTASPWVPLARLASPALHWRAVPVTIVAPASLSEPIAPGRAAWRVSPRPYPAVRFSRRASQTTGSSTSQASANDGQPGGSGERCRYRDTGNVGAPHTGIGRQTGLAVEAAARRTTPRWHAARLGKAMAVSPAGHQQTAARRGTREPRNRDVRWSWVHRRRKMTSECRPADRISAVVWPAFPTGMRRRQDGHAPSPSRCCRWCAPGKYDQQGCRSGSCRNCRAEIRHAILECGTELWKRHLTDHPVGSAEEQEL